MKNIGEFGVGSSLLLENRYQLEGLAKAFGRVGNTLIEEELYNIAQDIKEASALMNTAFSRYTTERLHESEKMSGTIVGAVLDKIIQETK